MNTSSGSSTDSVRLKKEADFQNARVEGSGGEARDRFYFLLRPAFDRYSGALSDVCGKSVLVIGCSEVGVIPLAKKGAYVTGIDVAEEAINRLSTAISDAGLTGHASAFVMNAEDLQFPSGSFDIIACSGVLHHLDIVRAVHGFRRVLKPSGRLVMLEPMAWSPPAAVFRMFTPRLRTEFEHPLTPSDFLTLRKSFGFVDVRAFAFCSVVVVPLAYFPRFEKIKIALRDVLDKVDQTLFRHVPVLKYFAWSSVIECRKPSVSPDDNARVG